MKNIPLIMFGCLMLTGCNVEIPPIDSCFVEELAVGSGTVTRTEVFQTQLKPLSEWFASVSSDWKFEIVDAPLSGLVLILKDKKERVTRANLRGDRLWIRNRYTVLSLSEREELLSIIGVNRMPVFHN